MFTPLLLAAALQATAARPEPVRYGGFLVEVDGLADPSAVAVGPDDAIYVAERFAHRVRVFDAQGRELRRFGELGHGPNQLFEPCGIAVAGGRVYVASTGQEAIGVFTEQGDPLGALSLTATVVEPPLDLDADARELVAAIPGWPGVATYPLTPAGADVAGATGAGKLVREAVLPADVALAEDGTRFLADAGSHRVLHVDAGGKAIASWGGWGPNPGQLSSPSGIDVAGGRVYVADRENHRIDVFDPQGKLLYAFGVHALLPHEGRGKLHYPNDVAVAPSGRFVVVCEGFEDRIQVFGPETDESVGLERTQQPRTTASHFGFGISTGGKALAVAEPGTPDVLVYDVAGEEPIEITRVGRHGARPGLFLDPVDVEVDARGAALFVADERARRIDLWSVERKPDEPLRYDPSLARLVQSFDFGSKELARNDAQPPSCFEPSVLALDREAGLWALDRTHGCLARLPLAADGDRVAGFRAPKAPPEAAEGWRAIFVGVDRGGFELPTLARFRLPTDLAFSRSGDVLYVVDAGEQQVVALPIRRYGDEDTFDAQQGRVEHGDLRWLDLPHASRFGGHGTEPGRFVRPTGIAAGVDGYVYVTDEGGDRIVKFDEQGKFVAEFGRRGIGRVEFRKPRGIAQAADGKLYVDDYGNHRGQVLTPDGRFVVAFGSRAFVVPTLELAKKAAPEQQR